MLITECRVRRTIFTLIY